MQETITISMRLPKAEANRLETAARALNMDKSAFLRLALRQGTNDVLMEQSGAAYRRGDITLSRAAEIAGVSVHEYIAKMERNDLHLNYSVEDLAADLRP